MTPPSNKVLWMSFQFVETYKNFWWHSFPEHSRTINLLLLSYSALKTKKQEPFLGTLTGYLKSSGWATQKRYAGKNVRKI